MRSRRRKEGITTNFPLASIEANGEVTDKNKSLILSALKGNVRS
jgi:hypothetical protein